MTTTSEEATAIIPGETRGVDQRQWRWGDSGHLVTARRIF